MAVEEEEEEEPRTREARRPEPDRADRRESFAAGVHEVAKG